MNDIVDRAFDSFQCQGADRGMIGLLDASRPLVVRYCAQVLENREDAEDAAQLVLLEVSKHAADMKNANCYRSWLYRVSRARATDLRRRRMRRENHEGLTPASTGSSGNGSAVQAEEARRLLFAALADLPDEDRALVMEYYFDKSTLNVLAQRRGCSKVAIWKRLERVRARLKDRLTRAGLAAMLPMLEPWKIAPEFHPVVPRRFKPGVPGAGGATVGSRVAFLAAASAAGILLLALGVTAGGRSLPAGLDDSRPIAVAASTPPVPLESAFAPPVSPATPEPAPDPERDEFKERIRKLVRQIQRQRQTGMPISEELALELAPVNEMIRTAQRDPSNEPEQFADFVALVYEVAGEESGIAFSPGDLRRIARLRDDLESALFRVPPGFPPARLLAAVEADLAFVRGIAEIVAPGEAGRMMLTDVDRILKRGNRKSMPLERLTREIVLDWAAVLQSEPTAAPVLNEAAGRLASSLDRITRDFQVRTGVLYDEDDFTKNMLDRKPVAPYDPVRRMEYQVEALKVHIEAIRSVCSGLDPAREKRLLNAEPWNYAVSRKGSVTEARN